MKLIVKTLSGKQLPIEIDISSTIRQLKEAIEKEHSMAADSLKLIAYGKVLDKDDNLCSDHSLKENDYIVAMVQKAKKPAKGAKEEVKDEEKPAAVTQPQPVAATLPPAQAQPATVPVQPQPPAQPQPAAALPPEVEASVTELMSISGKPREDCIRALQAAQNIPDVAFEFLMSGYIPPVGGGGDGGADYDQEDGSADDLGVPAGGGGLGQYNLDPQTLQSIQALVNNPSFPMIRQRMIQDPQFSAQFMQQLQQTQPGIFNAIQQNPGILMSLILGHDPTAAMGGMGGGMPAGGMGGGGGQPPPGTIQVSQEEMDSINRLQQLGFPKNRAAEAYFACDKNEEMAANFLFESGMEDEDTALQQAVAASQQQQPVVANAGANAGANVDANAGAANANPPADVQPANPDPAANQDGDAQQQNNDQPPADNNNNDKKDGEGDGGAGAGAGGGEGSSLL